MKIQGGKNDHRANCRIYQSIYRKINSLYRWMKMDGKRLGIKDIDWYVIKFLSEK